MNAVMETGTILEWELHSARFVDAREDGPVVFDVSSDLEQSKVDEIDALLLLASVWRIFNPLLDSSSFLRQFAAFYSSRPIPRKK